MAYAMAYFKTEIPPFDRLRKINDLALPLIKYLFLLYIHRRWEFFK